MRFIFKYNTSLELHECEKRLRGTKGLNDLFYSANESTIRGWIIGRYFFLWYQEYAGLFFIKNSFRTVCIGKFRPKQSETIIHGYIGMHPVLLLFLLIWFGGLLGFLGYIIASGNSNALSLFFICVITGVFLALGLLLAAVGRILSEGDREAIVYFIKTIFAVNAIK
jgi:hypothetical protein